MVARHTRVSFHKCVCGFYHQPGIVLGTVDSKMKEAPIP